MPARRACLLAVGALALSLSTEAAEFERAEIGFEGSTYHYTFIARLAAPAAQVRAVVTDFDGMGRINDNIREARVLARYDDGSLKRVLKLRQCVLLICFNMNFVERVRALPRGVEALMLPAESSFRDGTSAWTIEALDAAHARVTVTARQTPRFWIPPLLGPAILKRVFLEEVTESCANIERLALAAAAP